MKKIVSTTIAALATLSFAAMVSAADVPTESANSAAGQNQVKRVQTDKRATIQIRGQYQTAGDRETAPVNPPAVSRAFMVTPARAAVK